MTTKTETTKKTSIPLVIKKIKQLPVQLGCDPEFFFTKKGKVIGSEKILTKKDNAVHAPGIGKIICDGVQAEINCNSNVCRQILRSHLSTTFGALYRELEKHPDVKVHFGTTVKVTKRHLNSLSDKSKNFGCLPSRSAASGKEESITMDASTYLYRSAGGHIHLGTTVAVPARVFKKPDQLVNLLDIIVGNTCVLIDRDQGNIERRKVYGKAGEYRLPSYGLEYRTLSNFWLRSYPLMSLVMNLCRTAVSIQAQSNRLHDYAKMFFSEINIEEVRQAINTNDKVLALKNYKKMRDILLEIVPESNAGIYYSFPLNKTNIKVFEFFLKKGIDHFFKEDPLMHWKKRPELGFEEFLARTVRPQFLKS